MEEYSMEEFSVTLKDIATGSTWDTKVCVKVAEDDFEMTINGRGEEYVGRDKKRLFRAFQKMRDSLLGAGIGICCNGSLLGAEQSIGLDRDTLMITLYDPAEGSRAYERVSMLEFIHPDDINEFPTALEQDKFVDYWYDRD